MPKSKEYISDSDDDSEKPKKKQKTVAKPSESASASSKDVEKKYSLGKMKFVSVSSYKGSNYINIREYYDNDGVLKPGKKGISLSQEQWTKLKMCQDQVDADLKEL